MSYRVASLMGGVPIQASKCGCFAGSAEPAAHRKLDVGSRFDATNTGRKCFRYPEEQTPSYPKQGTRSVLLDRRAQGCPLSGLAAGTC